MDMQNFDAAFADAAKDDAAAALTPKVEAAATTPAATTTTEAPAATTTETPAPELELTEGATEAGAAVAAGEAAKAATIDAAAATAAAEAAKAATTTQTEPPKPTVTIDDDFIKRFAEAMKPQAQPQSVTDTTNRAPPPLYSAEEAGQLQQFYTEWPDVAKAAELIARGMVQNATRRMYAEMAASLAPYLRTIDSLADMTQYNALTSQVPDYENIIGQVTEWTKKQPAYLQAAYGRVINEGTSDEVIDLIDRWKRDTGSASQVTQQPAGAGGGGTQTQPLAAKVTELSTAAKQAAARLAPISAKRANATTAAPADFDGAFAEFAKTA